MNNGGVVVSTKETVSEKAKNQVFRSEPLPVGTLIMSFKLTIGKISRLGVLAFHNEAIISIHPHLPSMGVYLFKVLPQFSRLGDTKDAIKGATLNRDSISNLLLPLPPLAEQHRIVAKVDELMALCDRLEAAQAERERRRDRLTAASLQRLNAPADTPAFRDHADFHLRHLARITTRPDQVQALRETILNLAVRGQLVPQDPNDEPTSEILKRLKATLPLKPATRRTSTDELNQRPASQQTFTIPSGWECVPVSVLITEKMANGISIPGKDTPPGVAALKLNAISDGRIDLSVVRYLPLPEARAVSLYLRKGDFLLARGNGSVNLVARGALVQKEPPTPTVFPDTMIRLRLSAELDVAWFCAVWNSPLIRQELMRLAKTAVGLWKISQTQVGGVPIPLPPLAEQHRIVAKVDELMAVCDRLEEQLTTTQMDSGRLLEAVLHDALAQAV